MGWDVFRLEVAHIFVVETIPFQVLGRGNRWGDRVTLVVVAGVYGVAVFATVDVATASTTCLTHTGGTGCAIRRRTRARTRAGMRTRASW